MKIIGSTKHGYIAEISNGEAGILFGRTVSDYNPLTVGTEHALHKTWERLADVLAVTAKLGRLSAEFRGLAEITVNIDASIPKANGVGG